MGRIFSAAGKAHLSGWRPIGLLEEFGTRRPTLPKKCKPIRNRRQGRCAQLDRSPPCVSDPCWIRRLWRDCYMQGDPNFDDVVRHPFAHERVSRGFQVSVKLEIEHIVRLVIVDEEQFEEIELKAV